MDDFLASLYEEEREKIAAADLGAFMSTLQVDELEDFLGLNKLAVAGPESPELPAGGDKLDKEQKSTDAEVSKVQGQEPATRKEAAAPVPKSPSVYEADERLARIHRIARGQQKEDYRRSSKVRGTRQGIAGGLLGGALGTGLNLASAEMRGGKPSKAALIGGALLTAGGAGLGAARGIAKARAARRVAGDKADQYGKMLSDTAMKKKVSQGVMGGGMDSGMSGGGMGGGMENTAAVKAKIAMRVMRITRGAPEHIKMAAVRFAGKQIAELNSLGE